MKKSPAALLLLLTICHIAFGQADCPCCKSGTTSADSNPTDSIQDHSSNIPDSLYAPSEVLTDSIQDHSSNIPDSLYAPSEVLTDSIQKHSCSIPDSLYAPSEVLTDSIQDSSRNISDLPSAPAQCRTEGPYRFKAMQLVAPSVLAASGFIIHYSSRDKSLNIIEGSLDWKIQQYFYEDLRASGVKRELNFDNYLQYAPFVMDLGLGMLGAKARHSLLDRTIEAALGAGVCSVLSWSSKQIFYSVRPNGIRNDSFPSGHTDTVFLGAELVRIEYGWGWGAGAYAMGLTVGTMRLYNNWHWFSDILYGAAIGILSANIGAWMLEPVKDILNIPTIEWDGLGTRKRKEGGRSSGTQLCILPLIDPLCGKYTASFTFEF